ncbi:MAG: SLC13 family permease [Burkholderiaceae bacterium]|nr:SLC13 family permease [Burkholderiaceae bacterium]
MKADQIVIIAILVATIGLFLWGRWRHDIVAVAALLACVFTGLIAPGDAFLGFGHPAVITVACVLVLSHGLQLTGAVDALARAALPTTSGPMLTIAALTGLGAVLSAFMNNVGALALLMPVAIQLAGKHKMAPGKILMPLAFGTILGGMTTLIGTPPNLIVAGFRAQAGLGSFAMFDYTPVGLAVAATGVLFIVLIGWRIVPTRQGSDDNGFDLGAYITELRVEAGSEAEDKTLRELEDTLRNADAQVVGLVRGETRVITPNLGRRLQPGDILLIEAEPEALASVMSSLGLKLAEAVPRAAVEKSDEADGKQGSAKDDGAAEDEKRKSDSGEIVVQEMVVMPGAAAIGRSATGLHLRTIHGLNLLAVSRQGRRSIKRLRTTVMAAGDVLLMQGAPDALSGFASAFGCVPLAQRALNIPDKRKSVLAMLVMALAVAGAAFGWLSAAISFAAGVLLFTALRIMPLRKVYETIDWPVVVLLAALIPVAGAMSTTGTADLLATGLLEGLGAGHPVVALVLILVITMTLSDFMNNAATAAVMCPLAMSTAAQLGVNVDPFLMAVAIGASCAFLTPIGHQNNTLILGPGGFRFGDYWRLGVPMEVIVVAVSIPMLLWVWPL